MKRRAVIVNADDFGQSAGINRGVMEGHEFGIVTSASLMVRWGAARAAAAYARAHSNLSVGLHIDLRESIFRDGEWNTLYARVDGTDPRAVEAEVRTQLAMCRDLLGRDPTHLDSHQHVHHQEPARAILDCVARELGVPLRHRSPVVRYEGRFYGQTNTGDAHPAGISAVALMTLIRNLPDGVTELSCHPGYADDLVTMYGSEREIELQALCDPRVRRVLHQEEVDLTAFSDLFALSTRPSEPGASS